MQKILFFLIFALSLFCAIAANAAEPCKVVKITDGDTITVRCGQQPQERVRFYGIDAPEKKQAYGMKARAALASICAGRNALLDRRGTDRYGRTLAIVHCEGKNANLEMVEEGFAWVYRQYTKEQAFYDAEDQARQAKRGLWADPHPVYPSDFRKAQREKRHAKFQRLDSGE
jgi:endonuclease YncB( thermonuclease family)